MNDWQIDWLIDCLSVCLTDWLTNWPTDWMTNRLTLTPTDWHTDWLTPTEWTTKRLSDRTSRLRGSPYHWPAGWQKYRQRRKTWWQLRDRQTNGPTNDWWLTTCLTKIVDNQETLVYLILNVTLFKLLWWFCDRNCMREKIFIVKSRRDFAKAQGEDHIASLETTLFITTLTPNF